MGTFVCVFVIIYMYFACEQITQINKIRKCDLARWCLHSFCSCKRRTCIDYRQILRSQWICIFLSAHSIQRSKFRANDSVYGGSNHFILFLSPINDFLGTLILLRVHTLWVFFFTAAQQIRKYSDLAALLSNGLAHTIYFARLFLVFLRSDWIERVRSHPFSGWRIPWISTLL